MKIGYACICLDAQFHFETCIQKFATEDRLRSIIRANLETLQKLLEYNAGHNIRMYRLSFDLIPFGSSPVNTIPWLDEFAAQFQSLGDYVRKKQYACIPASRSVLCDQFTARGCRRAQYR